MGEMTQFDYTDNDVSGLLSQSLLKISELCSKWTSIVPGDPGAAIVELLAGYTDILNRYISFAMANNSLQDATLMRQVYVLASLMGASLRPRVSASARLTFTAKSGLSTYPVEVPVGTQISTSNGIIFETALPLYIYEGVLSGSVLATEGQTQSGVSIGGSDGTAHQRKRIPGEQAICYVNGAYQIRVEVIENGNFITWTYVSSLANSKATDTHYTLEFTDDGVFVLFGNNERGMIPPISSEGGIVATYRTGGGTRGMVDKNTLTTFVDTSLLNELVSVTNSDKAYGAVDEDDLDTAKNNIPAYIKTNERAISPSDYKTLAERYGGVAIARPFAIAQTIYMFVVPSTGGDLTSDLQEGLTNYLLSVGQQGYVPQVMQANYLTLDVTVEIKVKRGWATTTVKDAVINNLVALLNPTSKSPSLIQEDGSFTKKSSLFINDFGADLHIDAIYTIVRNTPGVEYGGIKSMVVDGLPVAIADVTVLDYQILRGGVINADTIRSDLQEYATDYDPFSQAQGL